MSFVVVIVGFLIGLFIYENYEGNKEWEAFNKDCIQYNKQYQCTQLWRSSRTESVPVVIPIVTPVSR